MGRVIVISVLIVVLSLVLLASLAWAGRRDERREDKRAGRPVKGDLTARQERELLRLVDGAARILAGVGQVDDQTMYDPEVIRDSTRQEIDGWLARYNKRGSMK